jgi:hypothetical protein
MTDNERFAPQAGTIVNPYIAGNPVTGTDMFFGRTDVFDFVRANLIGRHQDNILVLHGQRRTGKTSVLYQMHRFIDPSYIPILVDIQGMTLEGMSGFLWELSYTIQRGLRRPHGIRVPRPMRKDYAEDTRHQFQEVFLTQVHRAIGDRRLLLMLDESVLLHDKVLSGALEPEVFRYLSSLMQHYAFLDFLFTVGDKLEQMQAEFSTLFRVALYKEISFLDRDSTADLIAVPVRDQYACAPDAIEKIIKTTSGHPYYTQLICHELFTRWQQTHFQVATPEDVEAVLPHVIEAGTSNLRYTWDEGSGVEKAVMAVLKEQISEPFGSLTRSDLDEGLALHGIPIPPGEVAHGLQNLALRDVINDQEPFAFRVDLMRQWLQQHTPIEWVKEEIQRDIAAWEHAIKAPARRRTQLIGVLVALLVLIGAAIAGYAYLNRPISEQEAVTRTAEAQQRQQREATAQALAALKQDPAAQATATAARSRLEAIFVTQTAELRARLTATAEMSTATAEAIERATTAAIQTATAQPTSTPTPTDTPTPTPTLTPTDTPTPTETPTTAPTYPPTSTPTPTAVPVTGGKIAFIMGNEIHISNPDGSDHQRLTFNGAAEHDPAWSPDGRRIAYYSNITGNGEIWVMNADGSGAYQVTNHPSEELHPAWSPDGSQIAFVSERDRTREIYVVPAGGGQSRRLTTNDTDESYPAWSPDGTQIAFAGSQLGQGGLWTMRADGSDGANPTRISAIGGTFVDTYWRGGRIYFAAANTQHGADYNIYSVLPDGGGWSFHATGPGDDRSPSWSPNGSQMAFTNSSNLYVTPPGPTKLFDGAIEPNWAPK